MSYMLPFTYQPPIPTATGMRRRVREAIAQHRQRIAHCTREDIRKLMSTRGSGWDDSLWEVWFRLSEYRAVHAADRAHRRGEHLNRWAIWDENKKPYRQWAGC